MTEGRLPSRAIAMLLNPLETGLIQSARLAHPSRGPVLQLRVILILPNWSPAPEELLKLQALSFAARSRQDNVGSLG
jgi:hypothetical protein